MPVQLDGKAETDIRPPANTVQESDVGAIATASSQPLIAPEAGARPSALEPNLGEILDQQHGPLPEDANHYFETGGSLTAFRRYLESHGINPSQGRGTMGPQHLFLYNVLEETWKRIQEELKKRGGGNRFLIEQLLRSIRESVQGEGEHRVHYKDALREHESRKDDV